MFLYDCYRQVKGSADVGGKVLQEVGPRITAFHLDGCAHKIVYSSLNLAAGSSISVQAHQDFWTVAYTDVMPNW